MTTDAETLDGFMHEKAVRFAMRVLRTAKDWQDAEHALANHNAIGPWLGNGDDFHADAQSIIREAEDRLGPALPY